MSVSPAFNKIADLTIFQSNYARYSTREKYSVITSDGPVIYNPVDLETFSPEGERLKFKRKYQISCVTWSTNPFKGAAQIYAVAQTRKDLDFILCGSFQDAPNLPNVHKMGVLNREDLATALRSSQVLLTFSKNEACPNHVIEALACGLPVLYEDSGAMREVIGNCGYAITLETFSTQLGRAIKGLRRLSQQARERAMQHFSPEETLGRYVEEMIKATERPTRVPRFWRSSLAWGQLVGQKIGLP